MKSLLLENHINILCVQETEVENSYEKTLLRIPGFNLELENNSYISRVGFYVSNEVNSKRQSQLEGVDSKLIIIDIQDNNPTRIINVCRSFNPQNGQSQREKFKYQLSLIKNAYCKGAIILGDFNLDFLKKNCTNHEIKLI